MKSSHAEMPPPELSIVVISRTAVHLKRLFRSLDQQINPPTFEVLVSWNGDDKPPSLDHLGGRCETRFFEIRPYNFAANNNEAARHARGGVVLFLNDDTELDSRCLASAYRMTLEPGVGIVGANLRYPDGRLQHAGVFFAADGTPFHRGKLERQHDDQEYAVSRFVPAVTGAFIMMRLEEFSKLQFDETFTVAGEDICLCVEYRRRFQRGVVYCSGATAIHYENMTRKVFDQKSTPGEDLNRIRAAGRLHHEAKTTPKVNIFTEAPGWIMHRKAEEIRRLMGEESVRINQDWPDADIFYYINYGYYGHRRPGKITVANFTHFDPEHLAEKFKTVANEVDFCTSVSESTTRELLRFGVPPNKIKTVLVGADRTFRPKLTLGLVGRPYKGGRKGERIVEQLLQDKEIMQQCRVVSTSDEWGVPCWPLERQEFYRAIDYLLVPSLVEGGPVPFMEALASGTLSIAPPIGVVPQFPHREYATGDVADLKRVVRECIVEHRDDHKCLTDHMDGYDWENWAFQHELLFRNLMSQKQLDA